MFKQDYEGKKDIIDALSNLDHKCSVNKVIAELVILGGSALLMIMELNGEGFRPTGDIDINIINTNDLNTFYDQLKGEGIEVIGGIMEVPPNEDLTDKERLYELDVGFSAIKVYLPTIELLACCKIFSKRGKDLEDLESTAILDNCDLKQLSNMVQEYKMNLLNPDDPFLNVHELDRIIREKGI